MAGSIRAPSMISERSITDPPIPYCRSGGRPITLGAIEAFSLSSSSSPTTIISGCRWFGGGMDCCVDCCEDWDSRASDRSSSLAARDRNDASIPSCPKYQSDPGSGGSSANGSVGARVGDSLIGATMVPPGVEKCGEVACTSRLVDGSDGSGRGVRRGRHASGCGRQSSSLTVGGGCG